MKPHVSIILSTGSDRYGSTMRTLRSWERLTYPDFDFTVVVNADDEKAKLMHRSIQEQFTFITKLTIQPTESLNRVWRKEGMASKGGYVIFAMADELLGDYDLIDTMLQITDRRFSVNTFFLNKAITTRLGGFDEWVDQPKIIETMPEFWTWDEFQKTPNSMRKDGKLLTHITGAYREYWDYVGWFRNDEHGFLNLDRDLVVREWVLKHDVVSPMYPCCYHQYHPTVVPSSADMLPGYKYANEMQARLLEAAELDIPEAKNEPK